VSFLKGEGLDTRNLRTSLANIVLVYDGLDQAQISRDTLNRALPGQTPIYTEVPGFIITGFQNVRALVILTIEARRVEIKIDEPTDDSWNTLTHLASIAVTAISNATLVAYGFNIFASLNIIENLDARSFLLEQFGEPVDLISKQLGSPLVSMSAEFIFDRNGARYKLNLIPDEQGGSAMVIRQNVHYDGREFPPEDNLKALYLDNVKSYYETIQHLFRGNGHV
jgi:hypothetical protein